MADAKLTALTALSAPALEDITYIVDDPSGTPVERKITMSYLLGLHGSIPGGRITTESGVAISASDRTAQGTIYYTPYVHNTIRIYDGTRWRLYTFTELSLALTATSGKNYDVFIYDNAGTLTLELSAAWTNDTTRADALTTQDSVIVKSSATTRLWLGTIRASGTNVTADANANRYVWNKYNKHERLLYKSAGSSSHTYGTSTYRAYNNDATTRVELVIGEVSGIFIGHMLCLMTGGSGTGRLAMGYNSTTAATGVEFLMNAVVGWSVSTMNTFPMTQLGYSYVHLLERADGVTYTYDFGAIRAAVWI